MWKSSGKLELHWYFIQEIYSVMLHRCRSSFWMHHTTELFICYYLLHIYRWLTRRGQQVPIMSTFIRGTYQAVHTNPTTVSSKIRAASHSTSHEQGRNNADSKLLCHEWFHYVRHHVHDVHCTGEFATVIWRLHSFTVSFRGDIRGESSLIELTSVNRRTPQRVRGQFTNIIVPAWFEKWRDIKFWYMC